MALGSSSNANKTYLTIFNGMIAQRIKEDLYNRLKDEANEGFVVIERENKNGDKVFEKHYEYLEASLDSASVVDSPYGQNIELSFNDVGDEYTLNIGLDSRYGKDFMNKFVNVDISSPMKIKPFSFENDEGKRFTGVTIYQNNEKVEKAFTRDNPNGMPEAVMKKVKGKDTWDFTDQENFLYEQFMEKCKEFSGSPKKEKKKEVKEEGDLPF